MRERERHDHARDEVMMRDRGNWQGVLDDKFDGDLCSSVGLSLPLERRDVRVDEANQRNGIENVIRGG